MPSMTNDVSIKHRVACKEICFRVSQDGGCSRSQGNMRTSLLCLRMTLKSPLEHDQNLEKSGFLWTWREEERAQIGDRLVLPESKVHSWMVTSDRVKSACEACLVSIPISTALSASLAHTDHPAGMNFA